MFGISTITQKGQVVIPKSIRDYLGLKPSTKVIFEIKKKQLTVEPLMTVDQAFGMLSHRRRITKKTDRRVIAEAVVEKFKKKELIP